MHINRAGRSKGDSIGRCAIVKDGKHTFELAPYKGKNKSALLSKWYHPRAKVPAKGGWTYLPFAIAMQRGLVV